MGDRSMTDTSAIRAAALREAAEVVREFGAQIERESLSPETGLGRLVCRMLADDLTPRILAKIDAPSDPVAEAARTLLEAYGEDRWGRWEVPRIALNAAIDAHGMALTDISCLGFRCSPQDMLAESFRAALRALAQTGEGR